MGKYPLLVFVINTGCNQNCIYCPPMGEGHGCQPSELSVELARQVIDVALDIGLKNFRFSGGEPLLHKSFLSYIKLLRYIRAAGGYVSLNTNAVLLDQFIDQIEQDDLDLLRISLDSLDCSNYERITCTPYLEKVKENIEKACLKDIRVRINMVVMRNNAKEIPAFVRFCAERNTELKLLDLERHEFDIDGVWEKEFIDLKEVGRNLKLNEDEIQLVDSWGGKGMKMSTIVHDTARIKIKDSRISSTYTSYCFDKCDIYPCPEGAYDLLVLPDNNVTWCRRRTQNYIPLGDNPKSISKALNESLKIIMAAKRIYHDTEINQGMMRFGDIHKA